MTHRILVGVVWLALLVGCERQVPQQEPGAEETAAPANLFVAEPGAAQLLFVGRDSTIVPVGRAGAVFVPFSTFSVERDGIPNEFPPAERMAAMLDSAGVRGERFVIIGEPLPAGRAYAAFDYLGLGDRVALLDGGPAALAAPAAGADAAAAQDRPTLAIAVREDMIVDAAWVHERIADPNIVLLDARPPAEFTGESPGEGIERAGHIPGARNVFWQTLVQSAENPRLKTETELRRIFEEAGASADHTIVAYCRTGGQASFLYTVARHLGYNVRLYDGSFIDWSRTSYPVER